MVEEAFVPIEGVAKHFSVSISTVRMWIRQNVVPSLKVGGVYRLKLSAVEEALRNIHSSEEPIEPAIGERVQLEINFNPDEDI
jgi:hypothetical protein